ncbi:hypothetical protein F5Y09DRAFT_345044 [Xylaria sp. FL1042]|nr:hypothetical protein F5Y09DRAFT_345044 [Xylaria sp. FL1042]
MAELLGVIIAGAQAFDYALQLCKTIDKALNAAGNLERYQKTSRELISMLQLIQANPHLQAPEIISCTNDLIATANNICSVLRQRKRNRFITSITFAVKQKNYDDIFAYFERQKATLGLYISQLNTNALGKLTATSNDILTTVQSFYEKPLLSPSTASWEQKFADRSDYHEEKHIHDPRSSNTDVHATKRLPSLMHNDLSAGLGVNDLEKQTPWQSSEILPVDKKKGKRVKIQKTRSFGGHKIHRSHLFNSSNKTAISHFQGNIQKSNTFQIVGMEIGPNTSITDAELVRVTSGLSAHDNIHTGNGTQVIGQRVCAGAKPRIFNGQYCNNVHRGVGDQIIGFAFE